MRRENIVKSIVICMIIIFNIMIITVLIMSINSNIKEISNKNLDQTNANELAELDKDNMEIQSENVFYNIDFISSVKIILIIFGSSLIIFATVILTKI